MRLRCTLLYILFSLGTAYSQNTIHTLLSRVSELAPLYHKNIEKLKVALGVPDATAQEVVDLCLTLQNKPITMQSRVEMMLAIMNDGKKLEAKRTGWKRYFVIAAMLFLGFLSWRCAAWWLSYKTPSLELRTEDDVAAVASPALHPPQPVQVDVNTARKQEERVPPQPVEKAEVIPDPFVQKAEEARGEGNGTLSRFLWENRNELMMVLDAASKGVDMYKNISATRLLTTLKQRLDHGSAGKEKDSSPPQPQHVPCRNLEPLKERYPKFLPRKRAYESFRKGVRFDE